jgi:hypothetical protein
MKDWEGCEAVVAYFTLSQQVSGKTEETYEGCPSG